jgi:hypothetical protein
VAGDATAFGALFAPDAIMVDVEHRTADGREARPLRGRGEIEATARRWFAETPEFAFEVLEVLSDRTRAAARWRYAVPVAGGAEPLAVEGVTWLRCGGGRIEHALVLFDSHALVLAGADGG